MKIAETFAVTVRDTTPSSVDKYRLEIDGVYAGSLRSLEGDYFVSKQSSDQMRGHARPGNHQTGRMTVTKDWANTPEWYDWYQAAQSGKAERKSISVIFQNDNGKMNNPGEIKEIVFRGALPVKWETTSRISGHAQERLEITFETYELNR